MHWEHVSLLHLPLPCLLQAANSFCGQGVLQILQQHIREGGFQHPDNHQWYRMADVSFIVVADSTTELKLRFSQPFLLLDWQDYRCTACITFIVYPMYAQYSM